MKEKVEITVDLANALLSYLATKPYQEVYQLVGVLHQQVSPQMVPEVPDNKDKTDVPGE